MKSVDDTDLLQRVAAELAAAGYDTLDEQAKALGIHRSTAWTVVKCKHKLGRLNIKTRQKMLNNPKAPRDLYRNRPTYSCRCAVGEN